MKILCKSHIGAVRTSNQDFCECGKFSEDSVWGIVCDGMGGANGGNVASEIAANAIRESIESGYDENLSAEDVKTLMRQAIDVANSAVFAMAEETEELKGMGTTVVVAIAAKGSIHVAHVGDSRAYLNNTQNGKIKRLTEDHSYVQSLIRSGQLTESQARFHPRKNIITRVVGVYDTVSCDYTTHDFTHGETVIICTDGLSVYMDDKVLHEFANNYQDTELADELTEYALKAGGSDNISMVVIDNR